MTMSKDSNAQKRHSLPGRLWAWLRRPMISGLLVVVPLGITVFVFMLLYDFTAGQLAPIIRRYVDPIPDHTSPIVAIFLLFVVIYFIGMVAAVVAATDRLCGEGHTEHSLCEIHIHAQNRS